MHALIIEDEPLAVELIENALRRSGCSSCDVAFSARDAIAAADRQRPDLIATDQRLIDGTGVDAVLAICAETPIAVVFITANPWEIRKVLPEAILVEKPFRTDDLKRAVGEAMKRPFIPPGLRLSN